MKSSPMPSTAQEPGVGRVPSRLYSAITEPTGSASTISRSGCTRLKKRVSPVRVPAEPTPTTMASTSCWVCAQISGAVLHSWASGLAGLLNWSAKKASGMSGQPRGDVLVVLGMALADVGAGDVHFGAHGLEVQTFSVDILSGTTSTTR
jgi:hypothetical protein